MSLFSKQLPYALALAAAAIGAWEKDAVAANDPRLKWETIETAHFRINYYSGERPIADRIAAIGERLYTHLAPAVGWVPSEKTEITLTDQTDSANGSATALPFDSIQLYATAPDDMSPLGDVDDWYLELVTHEYTHILHTDHIRGIPAILNRLLGKTFAPNQAQPRWLLEGLAVYEESSKTSGGRLRSSIWNMMMRADVLEDRIARLDEFSNTPRRWPQGNLWYLYGSFFMQWVAETYGEDAIRRMIDDYAAQIIPYGINRSVRRATGRTFEELYVSFVDTLRREAKAHKEAIVSRGLREGTRLTSTGETLQHPRWIPDGAFGGKGAGGLLYYGEDGNTTAGLHALRVARDEAGNVTLPKGETGELLIRTNGMSAASFGPDGTVLFNGIDIHNNLFGFNDLFALGRGETSPGGLDGRRERLTDGFRASDPDFSPDGKKVVFVTNHRGTSYLQLADFAPAGKRAEGGRLSHVHAIVKPELFDQAYAPRFSPDGRHVAYSAWSRGGFRDIHLVDVVTGEITKVTHDRAMDGGPSFTKDGRWILYHSDRTGVSNVYAYETSAPHRVKQVTNVLTGAFQPELSNDGKTLAYVGYGSYGFDLFAMPFREEDFLEPLPYEETRDIAPPIPPIETSPKRYNPLWTLMPRAYSVQVTAGDFGEQSVITAAGADVSGYHSLKATLTTAFSRPELQPNLAYSYGRLPFDVNISVGRSISPRAVDKIGDYQPTWIQENVGATVGVAYSIPHAFDGQNFNLSYSTTRIGGGMTYPGTSLEPYAQLPSVPGRGMLGSVHLGWGYSNAEGFLWSVGSEKGFSVAASLDLADPALGSNFVGYAASVRGQSYFLMPWLRHHSLALHLGLGVSGGNMGGAGLFYVGGFQDIPIISTVQNLLVQGGIVLRGYPAVVEAGNYYALSNVEYRFPIVNIDRGVSTFPAFLNRINGAVFVDYGSAFSDITRPLFKLGTGAELWTDWQLGYILGFTFRIGFSHGWMSGGINKPYLIAAVPF